MIAPAPTRNGEGLGVVKGSGIDRTRMEKKDVRRLRTRDLMGRDPTLALVRRASDVVRSLDRWGDPVRAREHSNAKLLEAERHATRGDDFSVRLWRIVVGMLGNR